MKTNTIFLLTAAMLFSLQACKKGDTINNYYESGSFKPPLRKALKEYLINDSSVGFALSYLNNDPTKLKEGRQFNSGNPSGTFLVLYNSANLPVGFESYSPANNTLQQKGIFITDAAGRITKVIIQDPNGDTGSITTFLFGSNEYFQPQIVSYYNFLNKRNEFIEYLTYDSHGNMVSSEGYRDNGSGFYKYSEIKATGNGKIINPLNCIYLFQLASSTNYGLGSSAALLCSYFFPESVSEKRFLPNGDPDNFDYNNYLLEADSDNYLTKVINETSSSTTVLFMKY